jgi:membrane-bound lytic murein transglycosylase D
MYGLLLLLAHAQVGPAADAGAVDALPPPGPVRSGASSSDALSAEDDIDSMRALETTAVDESARKDAAFRTMVSSLAYGSALRDRLERARADAEWSGETLEFLLPPVTDIATFDVSAVKSQYDIPVEMQPLVQEYIHFFQNGGRKWFRRWMSRSFRFMPLMQPILEARGLPRDTVYLAMIESGFNTQAKSWARAVGPWQFIAGTAKMFKLKEDFWIDERRDPVKATHAAARYLTQLYNESGTWYLAWAGYNSGGGRVRRVINLHQSDDFWALSNKTPGFAKETKHYVPKLIACALVAKHPKAFGFSDDEFENLPPFEFDEVTLTDSVDLEVLATASNTTVDVIAELNPELKRLATPPASAEAPYVARIPKGQKTYFAAHFDEAAASERLNYKTHVVAKGDTLSSIARRYGSVQEAIMRVNQMTSIRMLKVGTELAIPTSRGALADAQAVERQAVRARRGGLVAPRAEEEVPAGAAAIAKSNTSAVALNAGTRVRYTVTKGDSLWSIARRFDVHVAEVREWNPALAESRGLKVGAVLDIIAGAKAEGVSAPVAIASVAPVDSTSNPFQDVVVASSSRPAMAQPKPPAAALRAEAQPGGRAAADTAKAHIVESGDSLWSLSQRYGCSVAALKTWNQLASAKLKLGQKLVVAAPSAQ